MDNQLWKEAPLHFHRPGPLTPARNHRLPSGSSMPPANCTPSSTNVHSPVFGLRSANPGRTAFVTTTVSSLRRETPPRRSQGASHGSSWSTVKDDHDSSAGSKRYSEPAPPVTSPLTSHSTSCWSTAIERTPLITTGVFDVV
jgi:hypothetical protein